MSVWYECIMTRYWMLSELQTRELNVTELAKITSMTMSGIIDVVNELERKGFLKTRKEGRCRTASLTGTGLRVLEEFPETFFDAYKNEKAIRNMR